MSEHQTLIVLQPTSFCNIDCSYCYLPHRNRRELMSDDIVESTFRQVFASDVVRKPIAALWHLGEPLAAPKEFYKFAFEACARHASGHRYLHSFQTNGTLLDAGWASFLRENCVRVGVSIDGPAFLHDQARKDRRGAGTHARVMAGVRHLQHAEVPFSAIAVLTTASLDHADAIFEFFVENEITDVGFNIDEVEGVNATTSFRNPEARGRYIQFMEKLLERIDASGGALKVRELWKGLRAISHATGAPRNSTNVPFDILNILADGTVSTFCPELATAKDVSGRSFALGNIVMDRLEDMATSDRFIALRTEVEAGRDRCRSTCDYWKFCGGGSPSNKFFEHGRLDVADTLVCDVHMKATLEVVLDYVEGHLRQPVALPGR